VISCSNCGKENPAEASFCMSCATRLGAPIRSVFEERKVVTALFCDLVGFTATSESADPEDIDRMLLSYASMARTQIESHGGVVEKFIGDAVVGVFGVPAAHEDDPERAVRAGLRIVEVAEELEAIGGAPLRLRVGINSGETLVHLGITPGSGERMLAGDAINTASRIQSVAPEMGVAVGLTAYEATSTVFDYEELESATLKGKSEPVRVFHARSPFARIGIDITRTHHSPYVGRAIEVSLLRALFDKSVGETSVQFATVVGEPGIGKSRIVAQLLAYAQEREPRLTWRQGRCLPYGDGVTFWALGEIVKAHAGILESDDPEQASTKLGNSVPQGPDREWMRRRLLPLVGVDASSPAERDELFAAWRSFLETVAEQTPTVLVFEDLHWADDGMLAFLEYLAHRSEGVSLLVLGTARPELYERHPDYAQSLGSASRINLGPLSDAESLELISGLLDNSEIREMRIPILDRADGNPLYVEEFLRLLKDRGLLVEEGGAWVLRPESELPLPGSIHSLLAARLDTLSPERKAMLSDAAVVGKVFWAGAVAAMGDRELEDVTSAMRELSHKELVRITRRSSMQGESEYAFWHVLTRDVAYGQLPRASRASRHVAAAHWIESKARERVEDLADVLAYHYAAALELARAAGQPEQADLVVAALRFLTLAGERALGLDTIAALSNFERALTLMPPLHPDRPEALVRFGEAAFQAGRLAESEEALEEATASFRARGDPAATARAMLMHAVPLQGLGDPRGWTLPLEALALLEPLPPGPDLVAALTDVSAIETLSGRPEAGIRYAERALVLAEELGLSRPAEALDFRGVARGALGDPRGLSDLREAISIASETGDGHEVAKLHNNLSAQLWGFEGPAASFEVSRAGVDFARSRGLIGVLDFLLAGDLDLLIDVGELDEALAIADDMAPRKEAKGDVADLVVLRAAQVRVSSLRGQGDRLASRIDWLEASVSELPTPDNVIIGLGSAALGRALLGPDEATASLLDRIETTPGTRETLTYSAYLPSLVRAALGISDTALAERLVHGLEPRYPYTEHTLVAANAALTESREDLEVAAEGYADAADRWERFGVVPEQAFALLGHGRCLLGLSRPTEAAPVLRHAREIFERLQAAPALAETDALLESAA
jgi:class 3 adenylate cyclase/tetratricopeptide (TPR) repeat protein